MLGAVLLFGALAGVDNLQVCSSVGLLPLDRRRRHLLAAAFSLCETVAPLVGLSLGHLLLGTLGAGAAKAGPLLMLLCGAAVLWDRPPGLSYGRGRLDPFVGQVGNLRRVDNPPLDACVSPSRTDHRLLWSVSRLLAGGAGSQPARRISSCPTLFGLPLSLSLDNLLGGAGISALGYPMVPAALLIGLVSAGMSCAGLYLSGWLQRFFGERIVARCVEPAVGAYLCLLAVRLLIANRS